MPSLYVGETCRSVQERAKEHWTDYRRGCKDSHILKHWVLHHNSEGEPRFIMKVVQHHRSALSRQVGEATRIQRRGVTLNSKGGYNRSALTRLTLAAEESDVSKEWENGIEKDYTTGMFKKRKEVDRRDRAGNVAGGIWKEGKRKADVEQMGREEGRRRKKRRFEVIKGDWGERDDGKKDDSNDDPHTSSVEKLVEDKSLEHDECDVVTVWDEAEKVCEKISEKLRMSKPIGAKKIWTKLNNGLYGWRKMPTAKRRCTTTTASSGCRQGRGTTSARMPSVSTQRSPSSVTAKEKPTAKKLHAFSTAKEAKINGCGTAPDCVVLDGLSDFMKNSKSETYFGRERDNSVGELRPRPSGVNRGQGK